MRVFVTGATGHIGSVVVKELLDHGHQVLGLARSAASAEALTAAGAEVQRGSLDDLDALSAAAASADGVIHLAFKHDFSDYAAAAATDLQAVETIGTALVGSGKAFVNTSGTMMLAFAAPGRLGGEDDVTDESGPRVASENATIALAAARGEVLDHPTGADGARLHRLPRLRPQSHRRRPDDGPIRLRR